MLTGKARMTKNSEYDRQNDRRPFRGQSGKAFLPPPDRTGKTMYSFV